MPASGDWMFTKKFLELGSDRLKQCSPAEIDAAREAGLRFLAGDHLVTSVEAERRQFFRYYSIVSDQLGLGLTEDSLEEAEADRAYNMENYIPYP